MAHEGVDSVSVPDYCDSHALAKAFAGVELVFHLAARAHQRETEDDETAFHRANVDTTDAVVQACIDASVRRLVFVSSIGVHGNHSGAHPFTESNPPAPVETYALSKLAAERVVTERLHSDAASGTDYVILRPPLVYGPGCPGNFRTLLNLIARAPIVPLGALDAPRTFVYIDNLTDALLVAAQHPAAARRIFVIGDDRDICVGEIAREVAAELGRSPRVVWDVAPQLLAWIARLAGRSTAYAKLAAPLQVDAGAFRSATGWRSPFDPREGLRRTARQWRATQSSAQAGTP
jgi:nucleoside-diphosphate-sugar epimerase